MPHPWMPNSYIKDLMLKELGVPSVLELFSDIPQELLLKRELNVGYGSPLPEYKLRRLFNEVLSKNRFRYSVPPFLGGGMCLHYVPAAVKYLASRSEFYTAYTPYQPEVAQGVTQALFEYQSLIAELYGVDVVNASMYNGSTATAEAIRLAVRVTGRRAVVLPRNVHPEVYEVARTWSEPVGISVVSAGYDKESGYVDLAELEKAIKERRPAAVIIQTPNFFGVVEKYLSEVASLAKEYGSLLIVYEDPIFLGVLEAPGNLGADIVVGDTSSVGSGLNYGGPTAGILGIRDPEGKLLKQLPGRLIGYTRTVDSSEGGYIMVLQTREQHIRRERATSNITTNSALEAVKAAIYVSLLGSHGLKKLGEALAGRTEYLIRALRKVGLEPAFEKGVFLREVTVRYARIAELRAFLKSRGVYIGPLLGRFFKELEDCSLMCTTELHTKEDIDLLASLVEEFLRGA